MKKLSTILLFILPVLVFAQSQDQNYIKNTTYKVPTTVSISDPEANQAAVMVQYFDGLGRPIQQVAHKQSGTGKDIIVHTGYDEFGRQPKDYLPYVRSSVSLSFDPSGQSNTESFYATNNVSLTGNPHFETTGNPYSEKILESSPLSRIFEQAAPGNPWEKANGKTIKFDYRTNEEDEVVYFKANTSWSSTYNLYTITLVKDGFYAPNQLYKTITKDENWTSGVNNTTEEFKNKQGQVVLKRTYNNGDKHDTYYVYDIYGNLTYVIPPKVDVSQTVTQTILDGLCYQYKYDYRNRLAEKKLPGKIWEYIIYDKLDRVVATGPAKPPFSNLSNYGWSVTKYDKFNRPILTGWMSSASTINSTLRKTLQDARNAETTHFSESRNESTTDVTIMGITYRYSNTAWPTSGYHVLSVTYYDDYNYPDPPTIPAEVEEQEVYYNNTRKPIGLVTGTWTRVLRTSTSYRNETSYTLYDIKSRPIRVFSRNGELGAGGFTQTDTKFDFSGKAERTVTLHKRINSESGVTTKDFYTYSDQDRLVKHIQQINSGTPQLIAHNTYDELGNLISKKVGGTDVTAAVSLQKIDYKYNVRGWLKGINNVDDLAEGTEPLDLFAFKINYNTVENDVNQTVKALFNGNIAETFWKTAGDNTTRSYSYNYDHLNRLNDAVFHKNNQRLHSYDEKITEYDKNGNIIKLERNGNVEDVVPSIEIDDLTYVYKANSNELVKVTDDSSPTTNSGFIDGADNTEEYGYDDFGNMVRDDNKGITDIKYNHLNLPTKIILGTSGEIEYVYNALGVKNEKIVDGVTTKYMSGGYQYENNVLKFFPHAEGYVTKEGSSTYRHVFNYTDHLGNIRLKYCDLNQNGEIEANEILEENHYYPFGLKHEGYNTNTHGLANRYKYNGKEFQDELGLNVYDYGNRNYDAAIGRFFNMDRFSEKYVDTSPYHYTKNNPVFFIDIKGDSLAVFRPDGSFWKVMDDGKKEWSGRYYQDSKVKSRKGKTVTYEYSNAINFEFADPENDSKAIKDGTITHLMIVTDEKIGNMLGEAGALDPKNKGSWSYMSKESKGDGKLDFSVTSIPNNFGGASASEFGRYTPYLFLPYGDNLAHNHYNFGNFLWGAAGSAMGFSSATLSAAAHANSVINSDTNGYSPQFDSKDDQRSIKAGTEYSSKHQFSNRTWSPSTGVSPIPKK